MSNNNSNNQQQHMMRKVLNTGPGKNRIRFASTKELSNQATADVYRSYKRRTGVVTSASSREEQVHHNTTTTTTDTNSNSKRQRLNDTILDSEKDAAVTKNDTIADGSNGNEIIDNDTNTNNIIDTNQSIFANELDIIMNRNASEIFNEFYNEIWQYVQSLPEILHHSNTIIDIILSYMLSPHYKPETKTISKIEDNDNNDDDDNEEEDIDMDDASDVADDDDITETIDKNKKLDETESKQNQQQQERIAYITNQATIDILHLLTALARDLRHEIHQHIHTKIIPRIVQDLLNPPLPPPVVAVVVQEQQSQIVHNNKNDIDNHNNNDNGKKQKYQQQIVQVPLDVTIVESAFRTLSYIFRYDATQLLLDVDTNTSSTSSSGGTTDTDCTLKTTNQKQKHVSEGTIVSKKKVIPCLEPMRQYYGITIANRRELIRRLASECFAGLIRKLPNDKSKKKHLKRVINALASSVSTTTTTTITNNDTDTDLDTILLLLQQQQLSRTQQDAIDGISKLLYEVARGIPGQLHSKGINVVIMLLIDLLTTATTTTAATTKVGYIEIIYLVTVSVIDRLCKYLQPIVLIDIVQVLIKSTKDCINKNHNNINNSTNCYGISFLVKAITYITSYRNGVVLLVQSSSSSNNNSTMSTTKKSIVSDINHLLKIVLNTNTFIQLTKYTKQEVLNLFCTTCCTLFEDEHLLYSMIKLVEPILNVDIDHNSNSNSNSDNNSEKLLTNTAAFILIDKLMPNIPTEVSMRVVGSSILRMAGSKIVQGNKNNTFALECIHRLSIIRPKSSLVPVDKSKIDDQDDIFYLETAAACNVDDTVCTQLLNIFQSMIDDDTNDKNAAQVAFTSVAIAFVALLGGGDETNTRLISNYKQASNTLCNLLNRLTKKKSVNKKTNSNIKGDAKCTSVDLLISIIIDAYAQLTASFYDATNSKKIACSTLSKIIPIAEEHIVQNHTSVWATKSVASLVRTITLLDMKLNLSVDETFDAMIPNLRSSNHFLRLHTLTILTSFPSRNYVVDHADLDLTDDLDEEHDTPVIKHTTKTVSSSSTNDNNAITGACTIMNTLLEIESTPIDITNERRLLSLISRVEVLGRTTKLPFIYAEASAAHMMGLMYVRYGPIWPGTIKALVGIAKRQEEYVWQNLQYQITNRMNKNPIFDPNDNNEAFENSIVLSNTLDARFALLQKHDNTMGNNSKLFADDIVDSGNCGRVSRHLVVDDSIVLQSLWSVVENAPSLILNHSRDVVPIFLKFMKQQYYLLNPDDPDSAEMELDDYKRNHDDAIQSLSTEQRSKRREILNRLTSQLKVFSAVNGPQQLFKHHLLLPIFMSLVGHPDTDLAKLATRCVLNFKPSYLLPITSLVMDVFEKGKLRNSMMSLKEYFESGKQNQVEKASLLKFLSRLLFGRLSARAGGARSSKDTPGSRRIAIVTFLSSICESEDDFYPFIYLMIRVYLPSTTTRRPIEVQTDEDRILIIKDISSVTTVECSRVSTFVHQGFLNLLEGLISQIGYRLIKFIPSFMSIILSLCNAYAMKEIKEIHIDEEADLDADVLVEVEEGKPIRIGAIRSLCYRRLVDIFLKFNEVIDFQKYYKPLCETLPKSRTYLPDIVSNSERVPSLLILLASLAKSPGLAKMLDVEESFVPSVLLCLSVATKQGVVDTVLTFIEDLLIDQESDHTGVRRKLIQKNIVLLLEQFRARLSGSIVERVIRTRSKRRAPNKSFSSRRELRILCSLSSLIECDHSTLTTETQVICESLIMLLIPFLKVENSASDDDKYMVLNLLGQLVQQVSVDFTFDFMDQMAALFGPSRGKSGIQSKSIRQSMANVLHTASTINPVLSPVATVLQDLCAVNGRKLDEMDYDKVIPALNSLWDTADSSAWAKMCTTDGQTVLKPVIQCLFHLLFNDDGVVSRGALKCLKALILIASKKSHLDANENDIAAPEDMRWRKMLEGCVVPIIRAGLTSRNMNARRFHIQLIGEVAICCASASSPNLYGGLQCLVNEDEPDLDFFVNITHVQVHRHSKALQRLRKALEPQTGVLNEVKVGAHSLSNVLLPIAAHAIYDKDARADESVVLESIATVGAISRHLPWSKYYSSLWSHLMQFERYDGQEKYLVALICSILDNFHFEVEKVGTTLNDSAVFRTIEKRIVPKVKSLIVREKIDKKGKRVKVLRSAIILALLKLFTKLPAHFFEPKLLQLLTIICNGLVSKDPSARDVARATMAKMVVSMDLAYFPDVLRELTISLNEGYKLHVLSATVQSTLLELTKTYKPQSASDLDNPAFDRSVPALMDILQQDMFGAAQERKDAEDSQVRYVKEASGSKAAHSLELIASMIQFNPSNPETSSVHALVIPFLERLRSPDTSNKVVRRIKDCLGRIAQGLLRNPTLNSPDFFPFIQSTLESFVNHDVVSAFMNDIDDGLSSDDENAMKPIRISGTGKLKDSNAATTKANSEVVRWQPSTLRAPTSAKAARSWKQSQENQTAKVLDGANAPKLTGSHRQRNSGAHNKALNDPAVVSAVNFSLLLLSAFLKKTNIVASLTDANDLDVFVSLLTTCVCNSRDTSVMLLSMRCLSSLIRKDLPSITRCSKALASRSLELLTSSGSNQEIMESTYKLLTFLISPLHRDRRNAESSAQEEWDIVQGDNVLSNDVKLPLSSDKMRVLVSFLLEAVIDTSQHSQAVGLIRSIMAHRYISAEFYDLMETVLDQIVRNTTKSAQDHFSKLFAQYFINYPLSDERIEQHFKQILVNFNYEYAEGRLATIKLLDLLFDKLPDQVIQERCQTFFLPMSLRLVNDNSQECREAIARCIERLLRSLTTENLQSLFGFMERWAAGNSDLRRMALQLFSIFVEVQVDFVKRSTYADTILNIVVDSVETCSDEWEVAYFALVLIEKMSQEFMELITQRVELWKPIIVLMRHTHPWIKLASSRLVAKTLTVLNPNNLTESDSRHFIVLSVGSLYQIARSICIQIASDETEQIEELTIMNVKSLTWTIHAMHLSPQLCYTDMESTNGDPVRWVMNRLSNIAKVKGSKRRQAVFKCFAAFATFCDQISFDYLEQMLEPLHRSEAEMNNIFDPLTSPFNAKQPSEDVSDESQLAKSVLHLLEEKCTDHKLFLDTYAKIKADARDRKEKRKNEKKTEAIIDPIAAAKRRINKQTHEKNRRKRRVDEIRIKHGVPTKRRRT